MSRTPQSSPIGQDVAWAGSQARECQSCSDRCYIQWGSSEIFLSGRRRVTGHWLTYYKPCQAQFDLFKHKNLSYDLLCTYFIIHFNNTIIMTNSIFASPMWNALALYTQTGGWLSIYKMIIIHMNNKHDQFKNENIADLCILLFATFRSRAVDRAI